MDDKKIKKLLIVASIEPGGNEHHSTYLNKINKLSQIIESHWQLESEVIEAHQYQAGQIEKYDAIFVIEEYAGRIPFSLFSDILNSEDKEIIWSGFGSEELVVSLFNQYLLPEKEINLSDYYLEYKGVDFSLEEFHYLKRFTFPSDPQRIKVLANLKKEDDITTIPLIFNIDEKFLIIPFETPFSYEIDNYTLVFLDVLHHAFGHHQKKRQALLRLEDIDPQTYSRPQKLNQVYQLLKSKKIPFQLAIIARYLNPPKRIDIQIGDRFFFNKTLKRMLAEGLAVMVQHGYTHQHQDSVSGIGFEFWDENLNAPIKEDSAQYVEERIEQAQNIMTANHYPIPDIWETPHYALSKLDNQVINEFYPLRYESIKRLEALPFVAQIGQNIYLPENLGFIHDSEDLSIIEENLEKLATFEDPVASVFWHPWRDVSEIEKLISIFEKQNFQFVSAYDLLTASNSTTLLALEKLRNDQQLMWRYQITEFGLGICLASFFLGSFFYFRNLFRIKKTFRKIKENKPSIKKLEKLASKKNRKLPKIAILVPARNEGYVIANTLSRLAKLNYPKKLYQIVVITDQRELDDEVEILTKNEVARLAKKFNRCYDSTFIQNLEVPKYYSGRFGSYKKTYQQSSKGRALNYALTKLAKLKKFKEVDMIGVLDADGRLDKNVLREVALKRLTKNTQLLQGPVFQISNFKQVSYIGIFAGLELAIHHMVRLAHRLLSKKKRPQFLAGTNYFIDKDLMIDVGGWQANSLVEDAQLALNLYIKKGITARWLSWPETEQTPANFKIYRKQRDRWVRGHLNLIKLIRKAKIPLRDKIGFIFDIYMLVFRVFIDLGIPIISLLIILIGASVGFGPFWRNLFLIFFIMSFFTWDFYGYIYRYLEKLNYLTIKRRLKKLPPIFESLKLIFLMPLFILLQSIPRITGSTKFFFNFKDQSWYKTERTKEFLCE